MDSHEIRTIIRSALASEADTGALHSRLQAELPNLRQVLLLPDDDPVGALLAFVTQYVRSVPSCLRLVQAVSKRLGFFDYAAPFLRMAEDYFLQPPQELPADGGLQALLDEAFLAHRLLEEVNDHHLRHLQRPLLPVDMTEANTIVHHLLGDEFATRLEQLVQYAASQLLRNEHVWDDVRSLPGAGYEPVALVSTDKLDARGGRIRLRLAS